MLIRVVVSPSGGLGHSMRRSPSALLILPGRHTGITMPGNSLTNTPENKVRISRANIVIGYIVPNRGFRGKANWIPG